MEMKDFDISAVQDIGKWEAGHQIPEHLRVTKWYGDYHMYEINPNIGKWELKARYLLIGNAAISETDKISKLTRTIPAGHGLDGFEWRHYGNGTGDLLNSNKGNVASYDFSELAQSGLMQEWGKEVSKFIHETKECEVKKNISSLDDITMDCGVKKEPAVHPVLEGYTWTHYDDGSGTLESDFGTKLAEYDLITGELTVDHEYFNFRREPDYTGLSFIMNKAEKILAYQIQCNVIGSYESEHNVPESVRFMKWSSSKGRYYLDARVDEDRLQRRYDYITKIANKEPVRQPPMCR